MAIRVRLRSSPKYDGSGAHRTTSAHDTWKRIQPMLGRLGVTRIADITGLDRVGIPTWSCVRPLAHRYGVTVTCGKGRRDIDARVGAVMETIEYYSVEPNPRLVRMATHAELGRAAVDPRDLILPPWIGDASRARVEWVEGWDIVANVPIWLPAAAVFFPYEPEPSQGPFLFAASTNGVAAGNRIEEAVCHALSELIERDAWSIAQRRLGATSRHVHPPVDRATVPASCRDLIARFDHADVRVFIRDITSDIGVASFYAMCLEHHGESFLFHDGMGTHLDSEIALVRALTEAAQSRAADIQGSREDLTFFRARAARKIDMNDPVFATDGAISFERIPTYRSTDVLDDIRTMIDRLAKRGLERIIAVNLTRRDLRVPVVRVVVPGLEVACVDDYRVGPRLHASAARDAA